MSAVRIAGRYARALARLVKDDAGAAAKLVPALDSVVELFGVDEASKVLNSPVMPSDLKLALIQYALTAAGNSDKNLTQFVGSVIQGGRVDIFPEIVAAFKAIVNEKAGVVTAEVEVVQPLDEGQQNALRAQLKHMVKKDVVIHEKIRPEILGGLVVRFGNSLLDLSVKSKLESIAKNAAI